MSTQSSTHPLLSCLFEVLLCVVQTDKKGVDVYCFVWFKQTRKEWMCTALCGSNRQERSGCVLLCENEIKPLLSTDCLECSCVVVKGFSTLVRMIHHHLVSLIVPPILMFCMSVIVIDVL